MSVTGNWLSVNFGPDPNDIGYGIAPVIVIPVACTIGILYAIYCAYTVSEVSVKPTSKSLSVPFPFPSPSKCTLYSTNFHAHSDCFEIAAIYRNQAQLTTKNDVETGSGHSIGGNSAEKVYEIYQLIRDGASSFLKAEYKYLAIYIAIFSLIIFGAIWYGCDGVQYGVAAAVAFLVGAITSVAAGYIGMKVATYSNARTAIQSQKSLAAGFHVAFSGGSVMGFSLVSIGLLVLFSVFMVFIKVWLPRATSNLNDSHTEEFLDILQNVMRALAGFGIGASSVALFARVGGGIYTKAADVGADLVGKVEAGIPEDDPRNPATIADNVGDNVGDIAGMGADLFGSFAGSTCASFVLAARIRSTDFEDSFNALPILFGMTVSAAGIMGCFFSALLFNYLFKIKTKKDVKQFLSFHELTSTAISALFVLACARMCFVPGDGRQYEFVTGSVRMEIIWWKAALCVIFGLIGGWIIGFVTEYYTSDQHRPVRQVAESCRTGAATNIIYGLALGYMSTGVPVLVLAFDIWVSMHLAGMYGVSLATLGVLTTLCTALSVDAFGPIADNAGGIAEMAELGAEVRERTDALDATGNTTAAIGKGFAIGSAGCVGVALMGAFQFTVSPDKYYNLIDEFVFAGLLVGAMLPYIFSALTMKAVGKAALEMVEEVRRQFRENPGIMDGSVKPDCDRCIKISTDASLKEMILPGLLVILTPLFFGFLFGTKMLLGILAGSLVSGVQLAISASNTGGAWDNAKKFIEAGLLEGCDGKGTDQHTAAVIGDTVGDPLKDTSGPALNILIKLMGIISVVFAKAMMEAQNVFPDEDAASSFAADNDVTQYHRGLFGRWMGASPEIHSS